MAYTKILKNKAITYVRLQNTVRKLPLLGFLQQEKRNIVYPALLLLLSLLIAAKLPANDSLSQDYTVQQGDTLYSLARRYSVSINEIRRINKLGNNTELMPGMLLKIPVQDFKGVGKRSTESTKSNYDVHIVEPGETYYSIARKYSMPISELLKLNGLGPNSILQLGQTLVVQAPSAQSTANTTLPSTSNSESFENNAAQGDYFWPVSGRREMLDDKLEGVRILALEQSLVYAVRDGKVMWQGPYRSYGVVALIVSNDGYVYLYGGNVHFLVNTGQDIRKGDPIGQVSSKVANQQAGQSQIYAGYNPKLARAKNYPNQVYFSVFHNGEFIPIQNAPRS